MPPRSAAEAADPGSTRRRWLARLGLCAVISLLLLLQGCTLSTARIARAQQRLDQDAVHQLSCQQADHCAAASPPLEQARQALQRSSADAPVNVVTLLDRGDIALAARINLIKAARQSIDIQTFIWSNDDVGKLMLDSLLQAAERGVKVRVLADQLFSFNDPGLLDQLAHSHSNLEVRLYNPTFHLAHTNPLQLVAGVACCFVHFNQRMHNKVMIVDGVAGITGGRNYEDRYFDLDADFDYVDRDVLVGGPVAQAMQQSFDQFWQHKRSVPLVALRDVNARILSDKAPFPSWSTPVYQHPQAIAQIQSEAASDDWVRSHLTDAQLLTGEVAFLSDLPAKTNNPGRRHALEFTQRIMQMISQARFEVIMQTPYLVMSRRSRKVFDRLHRSEEPPRIVISTNSLASTDAFAVYAASYKHRYRYVEDYGFEVYEMKPQHPAPQGEPMAYALGLLPTRGTGPAAPRVYYATGAERSGLLGLYRHHRAVRLREEGPEASAQRFGLHAKSLVIDDHLVMIGSHNLDPRSDHYNTEAGVIIDDSRMADTVRGSILQEIEPANAWVLAPRQWPTPVLGPINRALTIGSESLPVFDLWPYRYATDYQLQPNCAPLRPDAAKFYSCYRAVGDFPEVAFSAKLIVTRLITAFAAELNGVL